MPTIFNPDGSKRTEPYSEEERRLIIANFEETYKDLADTEPELLKGYLETLGSQGFLDTNNRLHFPAIAEKHKDKEVNSGDWLQYLSVKYFQQVYEQETAKLQKNREEAPVEKQDVTGEPPRKTGFVAMRSKSIIVVDWPICKEAPAGFPMEGTDPQEQLFRSRQRVLKKIEKEAEKRTQDEHDLFTTEIDN